MLKDLIAKHKAGKLGGDVYTLHLTDGSLKMVYNPVILCLRTSRQPGMPPSRAFPTAASKVTP